MTSPITGQESAEQKNDAYSRLRSLLLGGEVRPGQKLSHRTLAKDLGLSRSPVREALLALEGEGLIEHRPQSGVYLREIGPRELDELYDMRVLVEPYAAERAARLADASHLERLGRVCEEFVKVVGNANFDHWIMVPENRRRLSTLDREFHTTILAAADNAVARGFFENAQVLSLVVSWNFMQADAATLADRAIRTAREHAEIHDAIHQRDPGKAADLMRAHVAGMKNRVLRPGHGGS